MFRVYHELVKSIDVKASTVIFFLVIGIGSSPLLSDDIVYSSFTAGNGHYTNAICCQQLSKNSSFQGGEFDFAESFIVPPGPDYRLDRIEVAARWIEGDNFLRATLVQDDNDAPGTSIIESFDLGGQLTQGAFALLVGNSNVRPLLTSGTQYWLVFSVVGASSTWVEMPVNNAGVGGKSGRRPSDGSLPAWSIMTTPHDPFAAFDIVFRIVGAPEPEPDVAFGYTAYATTGPSSLPVNVTLFPEVFCPPNPTSAFFCGISATIPAGRSSREVCEILRDAINSIPVGSPDCTGPDLPIPPASPGFSAICTGNVLRLGNSTAGLCSGAFSCGDRAQGLDTFRRSMSDEHQVVSRPLKLKIVGEASAIPDDPLGTHAVSIIHTLRCPPAYEPLTFNTEVGLSSGMIPDQVVSRMVDSLSAQGDTAVLADGDLLIISPPICALPIPSSAAKGDFPSGNYDVTVKVNDRGLGFALTPIDEPFELFADLVPSTCTPPPSDIVAWWPFDEIAGTNASDIVSGNDGSHTNNPTPEPGRVGGALRFDGIDDYVRVLDDPKLDFGDDAADSSGDFSIDAWVNPVNTARVRPIVEKRSERGYAFFIANGHLGFQISDTTPSGFTNYLSTTPIPTDDWSHVGVTVDRGATGGIKLYVNGEISDEFTPAGSVDIDNPADLIIGGKSKGFGQEVFYGVIDEPQIYNRSLSDEELKAIYNARESGKCKDDVHVPWDRSLCRGQTSTAVPTTLCNNSTRQQTYGLTFEAILADNDPRCTVDGPSSFIVLPPDDIEVLVAPESCRSAKVRIAKPPGMRDGDVACYRVTAHNLSTGDRVVDEGSVAAVDKWCVIGPDDGSINNFSPGIVRDLVFEATNTGDLPGTLQYEVEAVSARGDAEDIAVSIDGLPPGDPVSGQLDIAPGATAEISTNVEFLDEQPFMFYDLLLRAEVNDNEPPIVLASAGMRSVTTTCVPGSTELCLSGSRFKVQVAWRDFSGNTGTGQAVQLTANAGYFWFFQPSNVEFGVKILDGRSINGSFWIFYGGLSNVEYTITVTDTFTGLFRTYFNPPQGFSSFGDVLAFSSNSQSESAAKHMSGATLELYQAYVDARTPGGIGDTRQKNSCAASPRALCLNDNRFKVEVSWSGFQGSSGTGRAVSVSGDSGYFWFFESPNVELWVKVLDGRGINGHFWVFYSGLSNVEYTLSVTDTRTGERRKYFNPLGNFESFGDTNAF